MHKESEFGIGDTSRHMKRAFLKVVRSEDSENVISLREVDKMCFFIDVFWFGFSDENFVHTIVNYNI